MPAYLGCQARPRLREEEGALLLRKGEKIRLQTWVKGEEQSNKRIKFRTAERHAVPDNHPHPPLLNPPNSPGAPRKGPHGHYQDCHTQVEANQTWG